MPKKLLRERKEFIRWLATPELEREINTQKALAEKMGVHEVTLSEWRHERDVVAEVNKLVDEQFGDDYPEIAESFKRQAKLGSFPHQKTYFEMIGKYQPKQEVNGEVRLKVIYDNSDSAGEHDIENAGNSPTQTP